MPESYVRSLHLFITNVEPQTALNNTMFNANAVAIQTNVAIAAAGGKKDNMITPEQLAPCLAKPVSKEEALNAKVEIYMKSLLDSGVDFNDALVKAQSYRTSLS